MRPYLLLFLFISISRLCAGQVDETTGIDTTYSHTQVLLDSLSFITFSNQKKLNGKYVAYYDNQKQQKAIEATYKKGKLIGTEKQWYEDGKIFSEKKYVNDTCTMDYFYPDGALMKRDITAANAATGMNNWFYSASYCDNGQIKYSPPLNPDSPNPQFITSFYCSGKKKGEYTLLLVAGKFLNIGPFTEWFESGVMKTQGYYDDANAGKKFGYWNYYKADGNLTLQERYENGKVVDKMVY